MKSLKFESLTLTDIGINKVHKKRNAVCASKIKPDDTKITDLVKSKIPKKSNVIIERLQNKDNVIITMQPFITPYFPHGTFSYDTKTNCHCWWDKHPFDTYPVGIPVKYDLKNEIFLCDGIFCSLCCAKSFIRENSKNPRYRESPYLLKLIYYKLGGKLGDTIPIASDWRVLDIFGGHLTIQEFRGIFCRYSYTQTHNVQILPVGTYLKKEILRL